MAVSADLAKLLDKAYEESTLEELVDAPVAALAGISDATAETLASTLRIKTIGDLGRNKFFLAAAAITQLAESNK
jgi:hypothetical protein